MGSSSGGVGSNGCGYLLDKMNGSTSWGFWGGDRWMAKTDRLPAIATVIGWGVPLIAATCEVVGAGRWMWWDGLGLIDHLRIGQSFGDAAASRWILLKTICVIMVVSSRIESVFK